MDCNLPGSSVHGGSPGKKMEWVAKPSSRGTSQPRIGQGSPALQVASCSWATRYAPRYTVLYDKVHRRTTSCRGRMHVTKSTRHVNLHYRTRKHAFTPLKGHNLKIRIKGTSCTCFPQVNLGYEWAVGEKLGKSLIHSRVSACSCDLPDHVVLHIILCWWPMDLCLVSPVSYSQVSCF